MWNFGNLYDGQYPYGNLVYDANNGLFYAMTYEGGSNGLGSIISFNPTTKAETVVWNFGNGNDGQFPYGNLVYDPNNGLFYGMTNGGGVDGQGVILSFNPSTNAESVVWSFENGSDGQEPQGSLIFNANSGIFYGMTFFGGAYGKGAIISFNPTTNAESVLWSLGNGNDGAYPIGNLVYYTNNGLYYGLTVTGGNNGPGAIITFNPTTNDESVVWSFQFGHGNDARDAYGDLTYNPNNGLYYAMSFNGGSNDDGTIISFNPVNDAESLEWSFGNGNDGKFPEGDLTYDPNNGLFYGMTTSGGSYGQGVILSYNPNPSLTTTNLGAGTYSITVTDYNGCNATATVNISQPNALNATVSVTANVSCNGSNNGSITSTITGGTIPYTYNWSNGKTTSSISSLTAGSYTLTVTDAQGCSASTAATITQPALLAASTSKTNVSCNGGNNGSVTSTTTGGTTPYTYSWSNGKTTSSISSLTAGNYTITVTDANSCLATASASITQPTSLTVSTSVTNVSCNGSSNGSATATVGGGTSPYTYSWNTSPAKTTAQATGLNAGSFTVTVTDNKGCTVTASVTITQPSSLTASISSFSNITCNGLSNGSATSAGGGGTSPYTYSWSTTPAKTTASVTGLSAGGYTCTVTDAHGCMATTTVTLTQPSTLTISSITATGVSCNGQSNGTATATPGGGTSPYTYSWNTTPVKTSQVASGLSAGNYIVTVTDHNSCSATASISVTTPTALHITMSSTCSGGRGTATATVTGGTKPYTYSWSGGGTSSTKSGLTNGTYTVTVSDNHGCSSTGTISISCSGGGLVALVDSVQGIVPLVQGSTDSALALCCPKAPGNSDTGSSTIELYPNPTSGIFTIKGLSTNSSIEIYTILGQTLKYINENAILPPSSGGITMQINISNQPNGIYLVRIINNDGTYIFEKKVIKTW